MIARRMAALPIVLISSTAFAAFNSSAKGTTTGEFLKLAPGARAAALGEAYAAVADEASALYWNPAGLTRVPKRSVVLMHAAYLGSSFYDYAAYAQKLGRSDAVGLSVQYFSAGSITQTDDTGSEQGQFAPNDLAVSVGYAHRLGNATVLEGCSFGGSVKLIRSTILKTAQTFAVDAGVISAPYLRKKLRLSLSVANMGGRLRFEQDPEPLPVILRAGAAYRFSRRWLVAAEAVLPKNNTAYGSSGLEYALPLQDGWGAAARLGYISRSAGDVDGLSGVSMGAGLSFMGKSLDYAFAPMGVIGTTHRLSVSLKF